ncbi:MAG: hypothetical protein CTY36_00195 [Methylocystis sp.]|nr:MAG: hypothetical protein CTY36_00195 [Methylocystis sp.]
MKGERRILVERPPLADRGNTRSQRRSRAMNWTAESNKELEDMLRDSATYNQMAAQFRTSRSAVIGKVHRLGLADLYKGDTASGRRRRAPRSESNLPKPPAPAPEPPRTCEPGEKLSPALARERAQRAFVAQSIAAYGKPLAALSDGDCRWPLGDFREPARLFCAKPRAIGAYCRDHAPIAYERKP